MCIFSKNILGYKKIQIQLILLLHTCSSILLYQNINFSGILSQGQSSFVQKDKEQPYLFSIHVSQSSLECCESVLEIICRIYILHCFFLFSSNIFSDINPLLINKSISFGVVGIFSYFILIQNFHYLRMRWHVNIAK